MKITLLLLFCISLAFCQTPITNGNCTAASVVTCYTNVANLLACADGVVPTFDTTTCCYSCNPKTTLPVSPPITCDILPDLVRICAAAETPVKTISGCPTCIPLNGFPNGPTCLASNISACISSVATLPSCGILPPLRTPTCCLTCRPPIAPFVCPLTSLIACAQAYPNLRVCSANEEAAFNVTSCCRTCRRIPPVALNQPNPVTGTCTALNMLNCLTANLDICAAGEFPFRNETTQCCPSCRRPETLCPKNAVIECYRNLRVCAATESPAYVPGECCPTCVTPPTCGITCPTGVCVPRLSGPVCLPIVVANVNITAFNGSFSINLGPTDVVILIREIIQRFCEKNENRNICSIYADSVADFDTILKAATVTINMGGSYKISIPTLASLDIRVLLTSAAADPYSTGGDYNFSVQDQENTATTAATGATPTSSASTTILSALIMFFLTYINL